MGIKDQKNIDLTPTKRFGGNVLKVTTMSGRQKLIIGVMVVDVGFVMKFGEVRPKKVNKVTNHYD